MNDKKIIIFTWCHYGHANFGQILQCYALEHVCEDLGFDVQVLRYRKLYENESIDNIPDDKTEYDKYEKNLFLSQFVDASEEYYDIFEDFIEKNIRRTRHCHNQQQILGICNNMDIIIVGSDQLWNPALFDEVYLPDYLGKDKRLISYATSGISSEKGKYKTIIKKIADSLRAFKYVSVREQISREILSKYIDRKISVVVDPTLLLTNREWDCIASPRLIDEEYFLCFCYGGFQPHKHLIKELKKKYMNIEKICLVQIDGVCDNPNLMDNMIVYKNASPCDFLSLIKYSSVVCTDSFHAYAFSLIYQKDVYLLSLAYTPEDFISSERINNISNILGIESRWLRSKKDLKKIKQINYEDINIKLQKEIEYSKTYLVNALPKVD